MYYSFDFEPRNDAHLRGSDVLQRLPEEKVIWEPTRFNFTNLVTSKSLLQFCVNHPWTKMGNAVLKQMGLTLPKIPQNALLVEYGSSHNLAWVREDLKLLKAVSLVPNGVGVIMLAKGNGPLDESLETMTKSFGVSSTNASRMLEALFPQEALWQAPVKAPLPKRGDLLGTYVSLGIDKTLEIVAILYDEVAKNRGTWADFVAVYRYVIAQSLNVKFGPKVPLAIVSLEDFLVRGSRLKDFSVSEYLFALRQSLGGDFSWIREVRALNYPCANCQSWHHVTSKENCWQGQGQSVKKKCRLKNFGEIKLAEVSKHGAGLSGAGIYMAFGELGRQNTICTLARDYSKGKVYEVLESYLEDEKNGLHLLPIGSLYLYAGGSESGVSVDSLVFWEFLMELGGDAGKTFSQIWQALPVPFARRGEETHIKLCANGVEITKR